MAVLTVPAALALAASCGGGLDPTMLVGIARSESGLNPAAVHVNTNGSVDRGLMQINSSNFALLGLDATTAMDPCKSLAAAARLLKMFSRYNTGSAEGGFRNGYVAGVVTTTQTTRRAIRTTANSRPEGAAAVAEADTAAACPDVTTFDEKDIRDPCKSIAASAARYAMEDTPIGGEIHFTKDE